ncbi:insecticidal toxin complex protein [Streptomyces sp. A3M-1-3]|uniref:Tc toxin subunit A-related protein n=1 Tax=Streptomyces sp. A3M-1-3 TaxID=2962044 RepID=UPI0020B66178|nr:neuraminidase-like domain-containing protein [Streptomyces sp. A3M-1-3]MCP3818810.1 insecticidal toxin complex protein [Streptomyces sp. A3M-1-3]
MASLLVLRLHPVEPVDGPDFAHHLEGLTINAWDLTTNSPLRGFEIGTAAYVAPEQPDVPWIPHPDTLIAQHSIVPLPPDIEPVMQAVATAVIKVPDPPPGHPEHATRDLRLEISRQGKQIVHRQVYFNVPEAQHAWPMDPALFHTLVPSLFLALPAAAPAGQNPLELPADGTPPRFGDLRTAVLDVLGHDPGDTGVLATLTPQQARHVAYEIVWNRALRPLPVPPEPPSPLTKRSLEAMYTGRKRDDDESEQARRRFEGDQQAYYAKGNAEAERLAGFVFALRTAVAAEARSRTAERAGMDFPVLLEPPGPHTGARYREAKVILFGVDAMPDPRFGVPAAYFYVLSATMPTSVTAEKRYELAVLGEADRTRDALRAAVALGVLGEEADGDGIAFDSPAGTAKVNINQAARQLRSLGAATGPAVPTPVGLVQALVQGWLEVKDQQTDGFWTGLSSDADLAAHLELVLRALTVGHDLLITEIKQYPITQAAQLVGRTPAWWRDLFGTPPDANLIPPFIVGGSPEDRVNAFVRHVAKFFALDDETHDRDPLSPDEPPRFRQLTGDPLNRFMRSYGSGFVFGEPWDADRMKRAVAAVFPGDPEACAWLEQLIRTVDELTLLAKAVPDEEKDIRFSVMEALYARGFTSRSQVSDLCAEDFAAALTGTVAHHYATRIHDNARSAERDRIDDTAPSCGGFVPVNPDGRLVNCLPPDHLSPLGPIRYLQELLRLSARSTCEDPLPTGDFSKLGDLIAARRGPLGELLATDVNLSTPLPLADIVNECLEAVATHPGSPAGVVHDTNAEELGGHRLNDPHDPATLFAALPEHSSPATPVADPGAYDVLRGDFSAPALPYAQALDVNRTYLRHLTSSRYATMRRFREHITEFALAPDAEPEGFQRHLWRYPVRADLAHEYLGISPEEARLLYGTDIATEPDEGRLLLRELYGFPAEAVCGTLWTEIVVRLPEFLARTGLSYCEFLELWRSGFVPFHRADDRNDDKHGAPGFPDCEPCDLDGYRIRFENPGDTTGGLRRLAVFIRLRRALRGLPDGGYSFHQLRDICDVLGLFRPDGTVSPDFLRQLAAFQILRDDFRLAFTDGTTPAPGSAPTTGADRSHLLSLWVGPGAAHWEWAVDELLDQVHAQARHGCGCRPPEFRKLLAENLDPLSLLAGFDPGSPSDTWHARPAHTLRFAEVLGKIYASDFGIGEILYLFGSDEHVQGDDPFPLQPPNEALDAPLGLPDDDTAFSLWHLRRAMLAVDVPDEEAAAWSWDRISTTLRGDFGYTPHGSHDPLLVLGEHLFPSVLEAAGHPVPVDKRQYRTGLPLADTAPLMWNSPPDGPFHYDTGTEQLWTRLPLTDESVLAKLARVRRLRPAEQTAVQELYFRPRADLAPFAFLFGNPAEAEELLLQEPDEGRRWASFQREFARCHARCQVIATHLAGHVAAWTGRSGDESEGEGPGRAWALLRHLYADENRATGPWETDSGAPPAVTWPDRPSGGAFAALLGLTGTGLLGELAPEGGPVLWRETRGPMSAFGTARNAANAQIPTLLPALGLTLTEAQERFVAVRNGFALTAPDGRPLGGAQGYRAHWSGTLLVDEDGTYQFRAGAPTPDGQSPDLDAAHDRRWRVTLRRGQRSWVLLSRHWPDETAPAACSEPLPLRRGAYRLTVELSWPAPEFDSPDDLCPVTGGFEVKYAGPDSGGELVTIPYERLFLDRKDRPLDDGLTAPGAARDALRLRFTSTLRDIRRTYQRVFKALLFADRFALSAKPAADDGQSELGYLLAHAEDFTGTSYYRDGRRHRTHRAFLDFNLLPLMDNHLPPTPAQDRRVRPTRRRRQALFDWWERLYDYTAVRRDSDVAPESPVWLLFHEAAENHPDDPAHLLRHMGVDLLHTRLVLRHFPHRTVTGTDLQDERWAIRVWHADRWVRALRRHFTVRDIRAARPHLWASDDPDVVAAGGTESGNRNLTRFVRGGCIENGNDEPRRYADIRRLNDGLRERARAALVAFLCGMERVPHPQGGYATGPAELGEVLLLDVETGLCRRTGRIDEAIGAVHLFVRRAELGLEPEFQVSAAFQRLWHRRYADFRTWAACARRTAYRENWIDWDEWERARHSEAFRFLEAELRRDTLTAPVPGGLEHWEKGRPPEHPRLTALQAREPATMRAIDPAREGLDLLGTPDRHARPSWLAAAGLPSGTPSNGGSNTPYKPLSDSSSGSPSGSPSNAPGSAMSRDQEATGEQLPLWIRAAVRLGARFVRVAAASQPPASTRFVPRHEGPAHICCADCGTPHPALVDEYWFWTVDTRQYVPEAEGQHAGWDWHNEAALPRLLHWDSSRVVWLAWCRVHNGEFSPPRRSAAPVRVGDGEGDGDLECVGREADSLTFRVTGGIPPQGHAPGVTGFRCDLPSDEAVALPLVTPPAPEEPDEETDEESDEKSSFPGRLPAYPYFAHHHPGAPLVPLPAYAVAVSLAGFLRTHCRFQEALTWHERVFAPLASDSAWRRGGEPHGDEHARRRSVVLHYAETLLQWGDAVFRQGTPESFAHARLIFDTLHKLLGRRPRTVTAPPELGCAPTTVADAVPLAAPLNPRLLALYDHTADRLGLIRSCLEANRLPARAHGLAGAGAGAAAAEGTDHPAHCDDWCAPGSPYRFVFLVQKAMELAGEVRGLGTALLAAYEKGDAEYLASLRATQEHQLLGLATSIRRNQWRESDWQVQALRKAKESAQTRRNHYDLLVQNRLISREIEHESLTNTGMSLRTVSTITEGIAQIMGLIPDMFVGFPCTQVQPPIGSKLGGVFSAAARITNGLADISAGTAGLRLTQAGWERREEEWRHQVEVLDIELEQVERQILAAERRRDIALQELNSHRLQLEQASDVSDFLRDKFTTHDLYLHLQQETSALHHQLHELARHAARQAQHAFNVELGHTTRDFLPPPDVLDLKENLLAGDRLQLALRRMECAYLDENVREYELTKHFSLRQDFPLQFLMLQATGACEIELPEWMFDQDYGHYLRRIKNVSLTVPCVAGPYTGVHCRLTLLGSTTRISPRLTAPPRDCCPTDGRVPHNGYPALPDDPRTMNEYIATEAIATSTGQNDTGMFELNFRDERKLPFEFRGAISRWRIELRPENNRFDLDTVSDVVLHLNYTAREGGDALRRAAEEHARHQLPGAGLRYFDVRYDMATAWQAFSRGHRVGGCRELVVSLGRGMFPFLPSGKDVRVRHLELFFEAPHARPGQHHLVRFTPTPRPAHRPRCVPTELRCAAGDDWPDLFHGTLPDPGFGPLAHMGESEVGTFTFPEGVEEVTRVLLLCGYDVV